MELGWTDYVKGSIKMEIFVMYFSKFATLVMDLEQG